jgi:hypothetical protein
MLRFEAQRRWGRCHAASVVLVLLLSGCGRDHSETRAEVATSVGPTVRPAVVTTVALDRAGRTAVLPMLAPAAGHGVGLIEGTEVRLLTMTGETIAVGNAPAFYVNDVGRPVEARIEDASVALHAGAPVREWAGAPFARDCFGPRSEQRGRAVAVCGPDNRPPDRIDVADGRDVRTLIQDPSHGAIANPRGHWRAGMLSPDGTTVLAQWSGECEVPRAFFIDTATGAASPVTGESDPFDAPNSIGLTWADDRTALVVLPEGACGPGTQPAGLYAIADGQPPRLIYRARSQFPRGFSWRLAK